MAVKTCPKCQEDNSSYSVICAKCGTVLYNSGGVGILEENVDQNLNAQDTSPVRKNKRFVIVLLLALLVLCAVILIINRVK